MTHIELKSC